MEANTHDWLTAYMGRRARLASEASEFQCDPDCTRPGCKNTDLRVPVSLVDIVAAARHREESVSAAFRRHYVLGLFYNDTDYCLRTVSLKTRKPCPFLAEDLCSLYPVRPLPCILFPEILVSRGLFADQAVKEQFRDYLCMRRPLTITPERARVLSTLRKMLERENLITSFYLFGHGLCHLDFTDLISELPSATGNWKKALEGPLGKPLPQSKSSLDKSINCRAGAPACTSQPSAAAPPDRQDLSEGNPEPSSHQVLEDFFQAHIAGLPPFAAVPEKIAALDAPEAQSRFLESMQDDRLYQKLRQDSDDRALVFRFTNGRLKPQRRSVLPSEYKFYA